MHSFQRGIFTVGCFLYVCAIIMIVSTKSVRHHHGKEGLKKVGLPPDPQVVDNPDAVDEERWLEDWIDYPVYDYQGDAPDEAGSQNDARCPPYPNEAPPRACRARLCKSDRDCRKDNQRCCFNGCMFTCTAEMTQPAVVDWQNEPRRQGLSGTSWLIKGPEESDDVEPCTTTKDPDDGDPLLCPHGYVCHIIDPGDPVLGVPNRGQCMKEKQEQEYRSRQKILKSDVRTSGMCLLGTTIIRDQTIILWGDEKEQCKCLKGTIQCGEEFLSPDVIR